MLCHIGHTAAARLSIVATLALWGQVQPTQAQSIDPHLAHATLGEPLLIEVRVRHQLAPQASVTTKCLQAEVDLGDQYLGPDELHISLLPDSVPGWQRVRLTHPVRVQEPVIHARLALTCGARYFSEFPVLADPPGRHANTGRRPRFEPRARRPAAESAVAQSATLVTAPLNRAAAQTADNERVSASGFAPPESLAETPTVAPPATRLQPPTPQLSGTPDFFLRELEKLRAEQLRTQTILASMEARLGHREREHAVPAWPWLLAALGVILLGLARLAQDTWRAQRPVWRGTALPRRARYGSPMPAEPDTGIVEAPIAPAPSPTTLSEAVEPPQPIDRRLRWANADFGAASLENPPDPTFLRQIEGFEARGYPGAALALVEKALYAEPVKNPWLLLKLLDLYSLLRQQRNQEGVAAQLEALYNVHIPDLHGLPIEGRGLLDQPTTLAYVCACWQRPQAREAIDGLLLHPVVLEVLDLAAFRDLLLLQSIWQMNEGTTSSPSAFNPVIDWTPTSP
jgi:hypothetical protein